MVSGELFAQQLVLKSYDRSSGLASDYVLCMLQDYDGFIWFGTDRGVSRYDGKEFKTFTTRDGLPDNFITSIYQDTEGYIWFGMYEGGVVRYDGISFLVYSTKEGLLGNSVSKIIQDRKERIYFLTNNGLSILYRNMFSSFRIENKMAQMNLNTNGEVVHFFNKYLYTILPTEGSTIQFQKKEYISLRGITRIKFLNGIFRERYNADIAVGFPDSFRLAKFLNDSTLLNIKEYRFGHVSSIIEGMDTTLWCATLDNGITEVNEKESRSYTMQHGLAQQRVEAMMQDYEGNIWLSTFGSGVQKLSGTNVRSLRQSDGLPDNHVFTIYEDSRQRLWFGTAKGISVLENGILRQLHFQDKDVKEVRAIIEDEKGDYYIGTFEYLFGPISFEKLFTGAPVKKGRIGYGVAALALTPSTNRINRNNDMWIATYGDGAIHKTGEDTTNFRTTEGIASNLIDDITLGPRGIWFLSRTAGATLLQGPSFTTFSKNDGLQSNTIFSLYEEPSKTAETNTVWFGTDEGLIRLKHGHAILFAEQDGLIGQPVVGIFPKETNGKLLIVTPKGLHLYENNTIRLVQTFPFLSSENISINDVHFSCTTNLLWFATLNGVYSLDIQKPSSKIIPPKIVVTKISVDTSTVYEFQPTNKTPSRPVWLEHYQNNVVIEYAALNFLSEAEVRYRFRLEPLEKSWSALTKDRHVQYRNLNDGEYTFRVEAINGDGVRSDQSAQIQFVIAIPYWESWWFLSLSGFTFSGLLIGAIIYISQKKLKQKLLELERQRAIQNERERISRDLHDNVGAQVVNIISGLELVGRFTEAKRPEVQEALYSLQGDARATMSLLRETIWALQSSAMTIEKFSEEIELYIRKLLRYHPNILLSFQKNGNTDLTLRPVEAINLLRIVQEALTNCLKHASPTMIEIGLGVDDKNIFHLGLSNDGCKEQGSDELSGGKGIMNMERRAKELGGTFLFTHEQNKHVRIEVEVPLQR